MKQETLFAQQPARRSPEIPIVQALPYKRVRDASWDFTGVKASSGVYGIHPYPAMFHYLVVRRLLKAFSKEGAWVLDPFMGSGVVAVECLLANRNFVGWDINPLALMITEARLTSETSSTLLQKIDEIEEDFKKDTSIQVNFPNIDYWFETEIISDLSRLMLAISRLDKEHIKSFLMSLFLKL